MDQEQVRFRVTDLAACVPEGVPIQFQGREILSGPLSIELEEDAANQGVLDYSRRRAEATFHLRLAFPELAAVLEDLGVDPELTRPVRAVLRSQGEILDDHGFAFSGRCELGPHPVFPSPETEAAVLPGH